MNHAHKRLNEPRNHRSVTHYEEEAVYGYVYEYGYGEEGQIRSSREEPPYYGSVSKPVLGAVEGAVTEKIDRSL